MHLPDFIAQWTENGEIVLNRHEAAQHIGLLLISKCFRGDYYVEEYNVKEESLYQLLVLHFVSCFIIMFTLSLLW